MMKGHWAYLRPDGRFVRCYGWTYRAARVAQILERIPDTSLKLAFIGFCFMLLGLAPEVAVPAGVSALLMRWAK